MYRTFIIMTVLLGLSGAARAQSDYWQRQRQQQYLEQQRRQQQNHERQMREQRQRHEQQTRERQRQFEQQQRQNQEQRDRQRQYQQQQRQYRQPAYRPQPAKSSYSGITFTDEQVEKLLSNPTYSEKLKSDSASRAALHKYLTQPQREMVRKKLSEVNTAPADSTGRR